MKFTARVKHGSELDRTWKSAQFKDAVIGLNYFVLIDDMYTCDNVKDMLVLNDLDDVEVDSFGFDPSILVKYKH